ncbi:hypothetical protein P8S55_04695 [Halomonas sp. M1]|uniref:hypothetical protein n=1 Tax=unclassified Halomonas TaxID=2609666 RepID=UPI00023A3874|nr:MULTISPECIES: hypothetical protein [unclassified Halomonas]AVI62998.1 hypothetical protein BB497_09995 [Halomonas sp. GFAJ-1]EHK60308.1 hypothetical protein MOY_11432 [Halomonas sp. GFAJ-1]MDP3535974.1 hypothetical protein [Halomonas sp.]WFE72395.1 hypothetical protein P8S55_04695 [Halomonas sp. M1]
MSQLKNQIGTAIVPAVIQALMVCVVRFFTIPWSIWKGAALRLAAMRQSSDEEKVASSKSEFPVFDWFRAAWDGAIFLSWFVGILASVIALIGGSMGYGGLMAGIAAGITVLVYFYFAVIGMSLLKEGLILVLSIALNMERLVNKGEKQSS